MLDKIETVTMAEPWYVTLARGYYLASMRLKARTIHRARLPDTAPVGFGNGKTAVPTTYRAVGETCPGSCPRLPEHLGGDGTCFGLFGRTALSSKRDREAGSPRDNAIRAACLAIGVAGTTVNSKGRPVAARIHGVGDFGADGVVDVEYVEAVAAIGREVQRLSGRREVAFGYTHFEGGPWLDTLWEAGIMIRISDRDGAMGSIVVNGFDADDLRRRNAFACLEQARGLTCAECRLCWTNPGKAVAFDAMGLREGKLRDVLSRG